MAHLETREPSRAPFYVVYDDGIVCECATRGLVRSHVHDRVGLLHQVVLVVRIKEWKA